MEDPVSEWKGVPVPVLPRGPNLRKVFRFSNPLAKSESARRLYESSGRLCSLRSVPVSRRGCLGVQSEVPVGATDYPSGRLIEDK